MNRSFTCFLCSQFVLVLSLLGSASMGAAAAEPDADVSTKQNIDVVFVLDNSGSMRENDPEFLTRAAVGNFAASLASDPELDGQIGIVLFDGQARLVQSLTPIRSGETQALLAESLEALDFSGQRTNTPAGIERALYEIRENGRAEARQAIVLLSDGKIDIGEARLDLEAARWLRDDLAGESRASGVKLFGVAFTDDADYQLMQALARRTDASYYRAFEAAELANVVDDVLLRISEAQAFEVASPTLIAPEPVPPINPPQPDVAAAPLVGEEGSEFGLLSLLPLALLFVAGGLVWQRRTRTKPGSSRALESALSPSAPPAQLLDVGGEVGEIGGSTPLGTGRTRIGRDSHNELVIEDDTISSEHAFIEVRNGRYWLEDQRSTNGTRLNDERLDPNQARQLKGGDHIRLAEIDLMFVLAGYVPAGETVYLSEATSPPADWRASVDTVHPASAIAAIEKDSPVEAKTDAAQRLDQAPVDEERDVPAPEAELRPEPQHEVEPEPEIEPEPEQESEVEVALKPEQEAEIGSEPEPEREAEIESQPEPEAEPEPEPEPEPDDSEEYRHCLDYHLERVAEISPAFASFIGNVFDEEIRGALGVSARDLVADARESGRIQKKIYTFERVRFVICGIPDEMASARDFYVEAFGGFTRMLSEQLQSDAFRTDHCETLAVLTFGLGDAPWVSLSIVPDEDKEPRIDLLSYEFLTEEERQELDPAEHSEFSQSELG